MTKVARNQNNNTARQPCIKICVLWKGEQRGPVKQQTTKAVWSGPGNCPFFLRFLCPCHLSGLWTRPFALTSATFCIQTEVRGHTSGLFPKPHWQIQTVTPSQTGREPRRAVSFTSSTQPKLCRLLWDQTIKPEKSVRLLLSSHHPCSLNSTFTRTAAAAGSKKLRSRLACLRFGDNRSTTETMRFLNVCAKRRVVHSTRGVPGILGPSPFSTDWLDFGRIEFWKNIHV